MARRIWVVRDKKLVEITEDFQPTPRTEIMRDEMAPTKHPINGKFYTSKKEFRRITKMHGCVEMGNDFKLPNKESVLPGGRREAIVQAYKEWNKKNNGRDSIY